MSFYPVVTRLTLASSQIQVEEVDVSGIKPGVLSNVGLLMCKLVTEGTSGERREVATLNMVVNIRKEGASFLREIITPFE